METKISEDGKSKVVVEKEKLTIEMIKRARYAENPTAKIRWLGIGLLWGVLWVALALAILFYHAPSSEFTWYERFLKVGNLDRFVIVILLIFAIFQFRSVFRVKKSVAFVVDKYKRQIAWHDLRFSKLVIEQHPFSKVEKAEFVVRNEIDDVGDNVTVIIGPRIVFKDGTAKPISITGSSDECHEVMAKINALLQT